MAPLTSMPNLAILNRIYVGSIQFDITEKDIGDIFGVYGGIRSVNMMVDNLNKRHKGYGFVEFDTPDAASLAQANMDGMELAGRHVRVGRPANFPVELPPGIPRPLPGRLYVANVHELIQEAELRAVFAAFGAVQHCNLVPDPHSRKHRGYGYIEYESPRDATTAVAALHGFELAARPLNVGRTVLGGPIPAGMASLAELPSTSKPRVPSAVLRAAQQINAAIGAPAGSPAALLGNLEDPAAAAADPGLVVDLREDIAEECAKFGRLVRCEVRLAADNVRVYVQYGAPEEAQQMIRVMDRRWLGGRQISAASVPVEPQ